MLIGYFRINAREMTETTYNNLIWYIENELDLPHSK